jgi:methanogenic corrinoid protein MtbC1
MAFDTETFSHAASVFRLKRDALAPAAVETLARDIVQRLAELPPQTAGSEAAQVSDESVAAFCAALVEPGPEAALAFIEARRAEGMTRAGVSLGYVAAAARRLGADWDADRLSFVEVTAGTGHLYAVMRALRQTSAPVDAGPLRAALFATVPGEAHGLGITVAADLFRDAGWSIDLQIGADHDALVAHAERTQPHVVGLSLSTEQRLDALARLVVALRLVVPQALVGVAPAEDMDAERLCALADIDLVFGDAPGALAELERLMALRD